MPVSRPVFWTATVLLLMGLAPFLWKAFVLDMPIQPSRASKVWRVEMKVDVRGTNRPGSVTLRLPETDSAQMILDQQIESGALSYQEHGNGGERAGLWQGRIRELETVSYTFRVHVRDEAINSHYAMDKKNPGALSARPVPKQLSQILTRLRVAPDSDSEAIVANLFSFVAHEVETAQGASDDDLLTLASREGSRLGKARLLASLLKATGLETRLALGLDLSAPADRRLLPFVEVWENKWIPLDPSATDIGALPRNFIVLSRGDRPLVSVSGVENWNLRTQVLHEALAPAELVSFMTPPGAVWRALSLYRLPIDAQANLRLLLVLPLAALIAAIFRNLIGIRTFGVFMPVIIALSLREVNLLAGLILTAVVLGAVTGGRILLDKLKLLFVPRLCLLLCLVILAITAIAQLGYSTNDRDLMTGMLLPIVIFAMLSERIAVTAIEEGAGSTTKLLAGSIVVAAAAYPIFHSELLSHLFFGFPELILCTMGALVFIGGYTGYRVVELWRFRAFASGSVGGGST
ncbi:MAG: hypothetical protein ACI8W3_000107 [Myxococcota bacterium]|jgi:hypothetical protein